MGYRYIGTSIVKAPSPALKVIVFIDHKNSHYKSTELGVYGLVELKLCCLYRQYLYATYEFSLDENAQFIHPTDKVTWTL